jgi:hypothetical protein
MPARLLARALRKFTQRRYDAFPVSDMRCLYFLEDCEKPFRADHVRGKSKTVQTNDNLALALNVSPILNEMAVGLVQIS